MTLGLALGLLAAILLALLLYWQLILAEGVYLGQGIVTLLYDWVAYRYNTIKGFDARDESDFLGEPLSRALGYGFEGVVLDVATGTGRLPATLRDQPHFRGRVVGVDHSARMLAVARQTLPDLPLVRADAMRLPFASHAVPCVTCLEALEFLPNPAQGLRELVRVLAPGGLLLTTQRIGWEARLMPGKTWTSAQLKALLQQLPLTRITLVPWQDIYNQVWAWKKPTGRAL